MWRSVARTAGPQDRRTAGLDREARTHSPHREVTELLSSWTNFLVTASSMICLTCDKHVTRDHYKTALAGTCLPPLPLLPLLPLLP